jgi:hypothetical protein
MTTGGNAEQTAAVSTTEPAEDDDFPPKLIVILKNFGPLLVAAFGLYGFFDRLFRWHTLELEWLALMGAGIGWAWAYWFPIARPPRKAPNTP